MPALKTIAQQNEAIIAAGRYPAPGGAMVDLRALVAGALAGTRSYSAQDTEWLLRESVRAPGPATTSERPDPAIEVTGESSMAAARRLVGAAGTTGTTGTEAGSGQVAVLDFASARNPGGGYLGGARSQEEDLCRVSALYPALREAPDYYDAHRASRDPFYSHRIVYCPHVPVFRDERYVLLDRPYTVSFITSPAPNAGVVLRDLPDQAARLPAVLDERAARVLAVAAHHGAATLVLGAWGCGVFRNDPRQVAAAFRGHLTDGGRFAGVFARIVFAVLDRAPGQPTLAAFTSAFQSTDTAS